MLLLCLRALRVSCTFIIVGFGSRFASLFPTAQPCRLHPITRHNCKRTLEAPRAGRPLPPDIDREVFVLTDGQVSNFWHVFDVIRRYCRLFSVGLARVACKTSFDQRYGEEWMR